MKSTVSLISFVVIAGLFLMSPGTKVIRAEVTEPTWFPSTEPMCFLPEKGKWIGEPTPPTGEDWTHTLFFRGLWDIPKPAKKACLAVAPFQTVQVYLNGIIVATGYDEREAFPTVCEVTKHLKVGTNLVAAKTFCVWRPMLYIQMRVEYEDGFYEDFVTDNKWEVTKAPPFDWNRSMAEGLWVKAVEIGDYTGAPEERWGHKFALLPRSMLKEYFRRHNEKLQEEWEKEKKMPCSQFRGQYKKAEYAALYRNFLKLHRQTGKLVAPNGKPLYLFFTLYNQKRRDGVVLDVSDFDFDQLEKDLNLMERAQVNVYLRTLGWDWLLDEKGDWAKLKKQPSGLNLPHFEYGYQLLEYFLDRVQEHGLYVIMEGDFYWSANHSVVPPPYLTRYYLYPEVLEAQALATRKILHYFSSRPVLIGIMIGEEDISMAYDLSNPHLLMAFRDYLRRKYGTIDKFKEHFTYGYDYADISQFWVGKHRTKYWEDNPQEEVLFPRYPYRQGVFDALTDFDQIPLPVWPQFRAVGQPEVEMLTHRSYNEFTPYDPLWIEYHSFREDELLFDMLCRWASIVRQGCPHQLLFYSNAQDFTNSWHFLHFQRRSEIPFEVIGVGCHDSGQDLKEIPPWATIRKTIKVVASYRPLVLTKGARTCAIASGEGEGGRPEHPEDVLNYYRSTLFDELGGGCAWTQTYNWLHISGAHGANQPHETPLLHWMSEFMPVVQMTSFSLRREVPMLIVRNQNLQRSNKSGLDYGNAQGLANFLGQLNLEFDIVKDQHLSYRTCEAFKVDLSPYQLIFLPTVSADYPETVWRYLDDWLSDPAFRGRRSLCIGLIEKRTPYLAPRADFNPMLRKWLGISDYTRTELLKGEQTLILTRKLGRHAKGTVLRLNFGEAQPLGAFGAGEPLLQTTNGHIVATVFEYKGNKIYAFGFPLGFAYNELWGLEAKQPTYDAPTALWEGVVDELQIYRKIQAPHNLRIYLSDDKRLILVKERYGIGGLQTFDLQLPSAVRYSNCETQRLPNGFTRFRVHLKPYGGQYLIKLR